ncbi:hypothetical protein PLESTB_001742000 [Pleodorina starrii]|uniref:Threonylcarbamoyl-AMP synthase n=1 Tax=Pleodorina starrii TaxID=330485 RepID=A0A9W6C036_9CHLO|nr:hypothetical protein PLESTM_000750100 [Pleodorina starrii]GLC61309.1 hypothetical protein PLESTB_001742000 [Pleodorina starrii]GLC74685.1 hypothetical protein PLESTF_001544600 [Pleodorina starrii]
MAWTILKSLHCSHLTACAFPENLKPACAVRADYKSTQRRFSRQQRFGVVVGGQLAAAVTGARGARPAAAMAATASAPCRVFQTEIITLAANELACDGAGPSDEKAFHPGIAKAAAALAAGEVVAIPTETVYGLAANALSASAVGKVYAAKNRPADNPLILHVSSLEMLASLYPPGWSLPPLYQALVRDLWPGPLTLLLPRSTLVPDTVTCGQPTMAVRMPAHPVALALIAACGFPLAAPSANSSGRPSPTLARHVLTDLGGRVPLILDGGACTCGVESTVLDGLRDPPAILRPGGVTREQLAAYPGLERLLVYRRDFVDPQLEAAPSTPGMKYRHYSPNARVLLLDPGDAPVAGGSDEQLAARLRRGVEAVLAEELAARRRAGGGDGPGTQETRPGEEQQHQKLQGGDSQQPIGHTAATPVMHVGVLRTSLPGLRPGPLSPQLKGSSCGNGGLPVAAACAQPAWSRNVCSVELNGGLRAPTDVVDGGDAMQGGGRHHPGSKQLAVAEDGAFVDAEPLPYYEYVLGHVSRPAEVASELFAALRHMDEVGVAVIVVEGVRDTGAGVAVMNRLRKAASRVVAV